MSTEQLALYVSECCAAGLLGGSFGLLVWFVVFDDEDWTDDE